MRNFTNRFYQDKIWDYTFIAVLLKCILFLGFTLDKTVSTSYFTAAFFMAVPRLPFYIGFTGVFLCFFFLLKGRIRLWSLIAFNGFITALLLIDLWYYRGYSTMTTFHLLQQTSNLDNLSGSIFSMIHFIDVVFIVDLLLLIVLGFKLKDLNRHTGRSFKAFVMLLAVSLALVLYIPVKVNFFGYSDDKAIYSMLDSNITSYNLSPLGYHILNTYSFLKDNRTISLSPEEKNTIKEWFDNKEQPLSANKYNGLLKGKNLIVIQLESFEGFVINRSVDGQVLTPNLNKMLNSSLYFSNIFEQVNQGTTSDAEFMLNTSIYPLRQGSTFFRFPFNTYNSLPKLLEKSGYSTVAIHSDKGSYWNWMTSLTSIGFQNCIDSTAFQHDESIGMGLSDGSYLRQVVPMLQKQKQPFYSFIVTLSNHAPFDLPHEYRELKLEKELDESTLGGYFQSVRYVDTQLGKFIENLKQNNMLDNTVIALYGDHEGVHKYYQKDIESLRSSDEEWLENHKHIPLIIYSSSLQAEEIITVGGQVDIMPTLGYLLGIDEKDIRNTAMGTNLLNTQKNLAVLRNGDIVGKGMSKSDKEHWVKGLEVADTIIRSNYFSR